MIIWDIRNHGGSVQHYYHFLFGMLLPVSRALGDGSGAPRPKGVILPDMGPMIRHVNAVYGHGFSQVPATRYRRLLAGVARQHPRMVIQGYDDPSLYDRDNLKLAAAGIAHRLLSCGHDFASGSAPNPTRRQILVIRRGKPDAFYYSQRSEFKGAGADRRTIPNIDEIARRVEEFGEVTCVHLEYASLPEQVDLFRSADLIIAQHGAALGNMVFCRPGTCILEIAPKTLRPLQKQKGYFSNLANVLEFDYREVEQEDRHAPVSPDKVAGLVAAF